MSEERRDLHHRAFAHKDVGIDLTWRTDDAFHLDLNEWFDPQTFSDRAAVKIGEIPARNSTIGGQLRFDIIGTSAS